MTTRIYLLLGGLFSADGYVTSPGMLKIRSMVKEQIPAAHFDTYLWGDFLDAYRGIMQHQDDKIAIIGYSGGGHKATWLANGYYGNPTHLLPLPRIDLMILYDPSPTWSMMPISTNVKKAINYYNETPFMLGLGGGRLIGPNVKTITVRMQHLAIQASKSLHDQTLNYLKELANS